MIKIILSYDHLIFIMVIPLLYGDTGNYGLYIETGPYISDQQFSQSNDPDACVSVRCLSGKLWYLQHNHVGDTIVYH